MFGDFEAEITVSNELDRVGYCILGLLLVAEHRNETEGFLAASSFEYLKNLGVPEEEITLRLSKFEKQGLVRHQNVPLFEETSGPNILYHLTTRGTFYFIQNASFVFDQSKGLLYDFPDEIMETLDEIWRWYASSIGQEIGDPLLFVENHTGNRYLAPSSEGFVKLDHNSAPYAETVETLDAAIEAVRGDNEYGASDPEDKEQQLTALEAGRKLLEGGRVAVKVASTVILETLEYLASIGVAVAKVTAAIAAVKVLLGL